MKEADLPGHANTIPVHLTANELSVVEGMRALPPSGSITITRNGRASDVEYFMETTEKRLLKAPTRPQVSFRAAPYEPSKRLPL